jgi:hypothetical protein
VWWWIRGKAICRRFRPKVTPSKVTPL